MSASGACVWSEGQLWALMTEASAIVPPALNEWQGGSELNGVTQIAGSWHIKAFCSVSAIQMEVVFFSPAVYCHFTPDFRINLLCETRRGERVRLGFVLPRERSVSNLRQVLLQWLHLNLKNQCSFSLFSGKLNWFFGVCVFLITAMSQSRLVTVASPHSHACSVYIIHVGQVETAGSISVNNLKCVSHQPNSSKSNCFVADQLWAFIGGIRHLPPHQNRFNKDDLYFQLRAAV